MVSKGSEKRQTLIEFREDDMVSKGWEPHYQLRFGKNETGMLGSDPVFDRRANPNKIGNVVVN